MSDPPPEFILDISDEEYRQQLYARTAVLYRDYAPGGQTDQAKRKARARKAWIASAVARRKVARGRAQPHRRDRQEALSLAYPTRQATRAQWAADYKRVRPNGNSAGEETGWLYYKGLFTRYRRDGQHYRTQTKQRSKALANAGRPRCRRTVYRLNRLLEEMGYARIVRVRDRERQADGSWAYNDWLRVELCTPTTQRKNVRPPVGAGAEALRPSAAPAFTGKNHSIPPPSAADCQGGHTAAERLATERVGPGQCSSVFNVRSGVDVVDVPLRDSERGVSKPPLDLVDGNAAVHQEARIGVPEPVGVDPLTDSGLDAELVQQLPDVGRREPLPGGRLADDAEQRGAGPELERPPLVRPPLNDRASAGVQADDAGLVALPMQHGDAAALDVDVFGRQRNRLADAQPGAPHHDDQRPVTPPGEPAAASVDQGPDLVGGERLGREPPPLDRGGLPEPVGREGHGRTVEAATVKQRLVDDGCRPVPAGDGEHGSSLPVLDELSEPPGCCDSEGPAYSRIIAGRAGRPSQGPPTLEGPATGLDLGRAPRPSNSKEGSEDDLPNRD